MKTSRNEQNPEPLAPEACPRVDWGDALATESFYGREEERALLSQWVVQDSCRVVSVLGIGGIGKSALGVSMMHQLSEHFEVVLFRSLRDAPSCETLLDDCLQILSPQPLSARLSTLEQRLSLLMEYLRKTRALVVLDNLECLLEVGDPRGHFRPGFEGYGLLLRRVVQTVHQSCLLLTSREGPADLRLLEDRYTSVRTLRLTGLDVAASRQIFVEKGLVGTPSEQESLTEAYAGNPLALKIVAETISDQFSRKIGLFLTRGTVIFGDITELLDEQFVRLSALEQSVLCWLAIMREPVTLDELSALLLTQESPIQILEAIDAGYRRSLIERGKRPGSFTLQSVVLEYVTLVLIAEGSHEIQQRRLDKLIRYGFSQARTKEYVRRTQERLLLSPLLAELRQVYASQADRATGAVGADGTDPHPMPCADPVEEQLLSFLDQLRKKTDGAQGYGPANLITLLRLLRGHLSGLDLSHLCIRGAYLQGVQIQDASLSGALIRDTILTEAVNATWTVAISPDGRWWAAGGIQGKVGIWEEGGRTLYLIWQAHADMVVALAFSPDERVLASGSLDGTVKLWGIEDGALLWTGWQRNVQSLAFTPDGSLLASAGADATVRLWVMESHGNKPRASALQTLTHPSPVYAVAFSPDGHLLASGCADGVLRLWERQEAGPCTYVEILAQQTRWIRALAFAPDSKTLASAHIDPSDQAVRLWDTESLRPLHTLSQIQGRRIAWSPDGRVLAGHTDKAIWLWDVEQGRCRAILHGHAAEVNCLAFAPDRSQLLSGSTDGMLRVWDMENGQCVHAITGYGVTLTCLDWSPDSSHLVGSGTDTLVTIWDLSREALPSVLRGHSWVVHGVAWSPNGRLVASCGWDKTLRLWDTTSHACVQSFEGQAMLLSTAWSPDGSLLACGTNRRGVQVWDVRTGRLLWVGEPYQIMFTHVAWSPDGTHLASGGDDGNVYVWESMNGAAPTKLSGHCGLVFGAVWSPDGTRLVSGSGGEGGGEVFVWDVQSRGACSGPLRTFAGHAGQVYHVVWSPHGDQLISGDTNGTLRWWDVQSGVCMSVRAAHQGTVRFLRVSPDGKWLASCGDDGAIMIWDLASFAHLQTLRCDRPYERLNITGIKGLNTAQIASLQALGAIEYS